MVTWSRVAQSRNVPPDFRDYLEREPPRLDAGLLLSRAMRERTVLNVTDLRETAPFRDRVSLSVAAVELGGIRSMLLGAARPRTKAFWVCSRSFVRKCEPFTDKQIALLENFAAQAVIAMENARLLTELRQRTEELARRNSEYGERIEQQSATIDVLEAMSASSGDAQPVFQVIVERARAFCNADNANLALVDGDMLHVQATTIGSSAAERRLTEMPSTWRSFRDRWTQRACSDGRSSRATRCRRQTCGSDPQHFHRALSGEYPRSPRLSRCRCCARARRSAPSLLARNTPGEFSATQVELLRTFAEQAVIAISSAETFKELQRRTADLTRSVAELQALEEVLRAVNSSLELETVLSTIISRAVQLSDADEGTIYEYDVSEQVFVPKSAFGMSAERVAALRERRIKLGQTHLGRSAILRAPVYVEDVQQDPSVPNAGDVLPGIHAVLAVPLLRNDTVIGGLVIRRRTEKGFAETIITLMQTFSGQAVLAIENARLFQEAGRARTAAEAALVDLRRAQDRLVQSEKMASLGQLTAGIAHEIKNPLNFVNNFAALSVDLLGELKETAAPGFAALTEKQRAEVEDVSAMLTSNLEKITEHGKRADGIVKAMLEHSRGSSGERRMVDLNALIDEALNLAYHGARAQDQSFNITLERDFGEGIAPIEVNPQDITRVFLNLFANGFYAATRRARDGGDAGFVPTLKVTTRDAGEAVEIRVRDNGTGIPADIRDKLFQPFFTTKPTGEGTGLGLSITYDIVTQQHGGSIAVDSKVGEYSEFTIRLPRNP